MTAGDTAPGATDAGSATGDFPGEDAGPDRAALEIFNAQFLEASRQGSWELLRPVLSLGFGYVDGATGQRWELDRYVAELRANPQPTLVTDQLVIQVDGDAAAVSARTSAGHGRYDRYVDSYRRAQGRWLCFHACVAARRCTGGELVSGCSLELPVRQSWRAPPASSTLARMRRPCFSEPMGKGAQTRQAVLAEALRRAPTVGLRGLTIGSLAEQTAMSKSGLFAHFRSKEQLQLAVVEYASELFIDSVLRPALRAPRGEPRLRAAFEGWLGWALGQQPETGGCIFVTASTELDDEPDGPLRRRFVRTQSDWLDSLSTMYRSGIAEGDFDPDSDPEQFAHELYGVMLGCYHAARLLRDPRAEDRARAAFDRLLAAARPMSPV